MLNGRKVCAIVPVRGGSKGIPRKNLYRLGRDTLLERTIKLGKSSRYIDQVVVSTDDPEMFEIAKRYSVNAPSLRPLHLATDTARTVDVVLHEIREMGISNAYILLLQVTSPLRTLADLNALFALFELSLDKADAIVSLTEHDDPHPNKIQKIEGGYVTSYLGVDSMIARQSLPKVYRFNGAFFLTHTDILIQHGTFMPKRTIPFLMPRERSINLDSMMDLFLLEALLEKKVVKLEEYEI
jgi:CMP-N,N'-diacetyllegionaminic acid synthase